MIKAQRASELYRAAVGRLQKLPDISLGEAFSGLGELSRWLGACIQRSYAATGSSEMFDKSTIVMYSLNQLNSGCITPVWHRGGTSTSLIFLVMFESYRWSTITQLRITTSTARIEYSAQL